MKKVILPLSVFVFGLVSCQQQPSYQVVSSTPQASRGSVGQDSPFRNNPALTSQHAANVDKVRRGLYKGEGYYDLGVYAQAKAEFNKVLAIDPGNSAAKRWLYKMRKLK